MAVESRGWPPQACIDSILGSYLSNQPHEEHEKQFVENLLIGWLYRFSRAINRPVVFFYVDKNNEMQYIENLREYNELSKHCVNFRKTDEDKFCREQDKTHAQYSCDFYCSKNISGFTVENREYMKDGQKTQKEIQTYRCAKMGFTEWMIPIIVGGYWIGVIITGQIVDDVELAKKIIEENGRSVDNLIEDIPTEDECAKFFNEIDSFKKFIENQWTLANGLGLQMIYKDMEPYLRGDVYATALKEAETADEKMAIDELLKLTGEFRLNRTNFHEGLLLLRDRIGLKGLHVFKPFSSVDDLHDMFLLHGSDLDKAQLPKEGSEDANNRERPFTPCDYEISIEALKNLFSKKGNHHAVISVEKYTADGIRSLLIPSDSVTKRDFANAALLSYAGGKYQEYPVAVILFFEDKNAKSKFIEAQKEYNIIERASVYFLTNWYAIYADYQRCLNNAMNQFVSHELANAMVGMDADMKEMSPRYYDLRNANDRRDRVTGELYDSLDEYIKIMDEYIPGMEQYTDVLSLISDMTNSAVLSENPDKKGFYPNVVLNRMAGTFDKMFKHNNKRLTGPGVLRDSTRSELTADKRQFEIIANNLINNACKYAHEYTTVYADCSVVFDEKSKKRWCRLSVLSYGPYIPEKECISIFNLGFRRKEAEQIAKGTGIGLYLVKCFMKAHGGNCSARSELICDYHIPCLRAMFWNWNKDKEKFAAIFSPEDIYKYNEALAKCKNEHSDDFKKCKYSADNIASKYTIEAFIGNPTARNEFIMDFPIE